MFRQKRAVVVRQLGGIGDVLALSPVFRAIKEHLPKHKIQVITGGLYLSGALLELMRHNPLIDEVISIDPYDAATDETKSWWGQFGKSDRLEDNFIWSKADYKIDLNVACIQGEANDIKAAGRVLRPRPQIWCEHAGLIPSSYKPIYEITQEERDAAQKYADANWDGYKKVIGVGITAADTKRSLPVEKIKAVCAVLTQRGYEPITVDPVFQFAEYGSLVGKRIQEVMPLLALMDSIVTVDSGILHMAGTVGTPVVGVFGPTDYTMRMGEYLGSAIDSTKLVPCAPCWYSYPCMHSPDHRDHLKCLQLITPEMIAEQAIRWATHIRGKAFMPLSMAQ